MIGFQGMLHFPEFVLGNEIADQPSCQIVTTFLIFMRMKYELNKFQDLICRKKNNIYKINLVHDKQARLDYSAFMAIALTNNINITMEIDQKI